MNQSALVTGVTGFTGYRLAERLLSQGYRVRGLVRPRRDLQQSVPAGVELIEGDISHPSDVSRAVSDVDLVFHLAALYRSARHVDDVYRQVNVEGTRNVISAIRQNTGQGKPQRLIHCSTIGVHGDVAQIPADESADFRPNDIYQTTKLQGELLVQEALREGLRGVVVRPSGIYGPGDRRFLKLFRMIKSRRFRMIGSGDVLFHLIYIDDLIDGFLRCAQTESSDGQTYILAGPKYVTLNELCGKVASATQVKLRHANWPYRPVLMAARGCEAICRALAVEPPLHRRRVEFFVKNRAFDTGKARREIGFSPTTDLESGLRQTTQWYQQHGWL